MKALILVLAVLPLWGQTSRTPLLVTRIYGVTAAWTGECGSGVIDNRSAVSRTNNLHTFYATGTGTWSVDMQYSDGATCTGGPWVSFGTVVTQASNPPIGNGTGYHKFIKFVFTGTSSANYYASKDYFPSLSGGGGVVFPISVAQGGTGATNSTDALAALGITLPISVLLGGTGSTSASGAVTALGLGVTGVPIGSGSGTFTGLSSSLPLQYLRRTKSLAAVAYEFVAPDTIRSVDYDYTPQAPGGSLVAGGINQPIQLSPCPPGINSASVGLAKVYLSGGTGTAEATTIVSFASGPAGICTIGVTPTYDHSGAWTAASTSEGWQEAINACPTTGCQIRLPATITLRDTVIIGNGTSGGDSTRHGVHSIGYGPGGLPTQGGGLIAGTKITWAGPSGGTMVQFNGPVYNTGIEGVYLDCVSGSAATAIKTNHVTGANARFSHLAITGCSSFSVVETAYTSTGVYGASAQWNDIHIDGAFGGVNASGFNIGDNTLTTLDVARSSYTRVEIACGASGTGVQINAADALSFYNLATLNCARSVYFNPPGGVAGSTNFPVNIVFYRAMLGVTPTWSAGWTGDRNITFLDYLQEKDGFGVPQPLFPNLAGIRGYTSYGAWYGGNFGINTVPTLATFEVFRDSTHASMVLRNANAGDSWLELLNEGVGGVVLRNTRATGIATIESDGVDSIFTIPLAAGSPIVSGRPFTGLQWATGTKPTCNAGARGKVWYVAGGAGVLDTFEVCRKDAGDAYAWVTLF